jgi:hypothetical protein
MHRSHAASEQAGDIADEKVGARAHGVPRCRICTPLEARKALQVGRCVYGCDTDGAV